MSGMVREAGRRRRFGAWALACLVGGSIVSAAPAAWAFYLPSFNLDESAWHATHIVVVSEGQKIDGELRVLESWHGDLRRGERLVLRSGCSRCTSISNGTS